MPTYGLGMVPTVVYVPVYRLWYLVSDWVTVPTWFTNSRPPYNVQMSKYILQDYFLNFWRILAKHFLGMVHAKHCCVALTVAWYNTPLWGRGIAPFVLNTPGGTQLLQSYCTLNIFVFGIKVMNKTYSRCTVYFLLFSYANHLVISFIKVTRWKLK